MDQTNHSIEENVTLGKNKGIQVGGVIVPAITPLNKEFNIDETAVEILFNSFYACDISPFILGTTGESASLSMEVKQSYLKAASKYKKNNTLLYAGISSNVLQESIEFAKQCVDFGVDVVAATLPSYYALNESQMRQYFEQLADSIPLPLVIYNIPATTHMSIPISLIEELSYHPNIVATKDSERSEERLDQSLNLWKDRNDFSHILGWAARSAHAMRKGSKGLVPSTGNLVPEIYQTMLSAIRSGDQQLADEQQVKSDIYGNLYQGGKTLGESLWALKVLMSELGLCQTVVMPPLQPMAKEVETKLIQSLIDIKE